MSTYYGWGHIDLDEDEPLKKHTKEQELVEEYKELQRRREALGGRTTLVQHSCLAFQFSWGLASESAHAWPWQRTKKRRQAKELEEKVNLYRELKGKAADIEAIDERMRVIESLLKEIRSHHDG